MTDPSIRALVRDDLSAVAAIADATLFPGEMLADMAEPALENAVPDIWLVALIAGRHCGFAYCRPEPQTEGTWNLLALAVAPMAQRKGIGWALTLAMQGRLREQRQRLLIVDTSSAPEQGAARAFYPAMGFEQVSVVRDYWQAREDKVTFAMEL